MTAASDKKAGDQQAGELKRYGIECLPSDAFLWGGFRYTHARDAIAAAKRGDVR